MVQADRPDDDGPVVNVPQVIASNVILWIGLTALCRFAGWSWAWSVIASWVGASALTFLGCVMLYLLAGKFRRGLSFRAAVSSHVLTAKTPDELAAWDADGDAEVSLAVSTLIDRGEHRPIHPGPCELVRMWDEDAQEDTDNAAPSLQNRRERR